MNNIYAEVKKRSNGKYDDIRFSKVTFAANSAKITVVCTADKLDSVKKNGAELVALIRDICSFNCGVSIEFVAENITASGLRSFAAEFIGKFPYMASAVNDMEVESGVIKLKMHKTMHELAKSDFLPRFEEHLKNSFVTPVKFETELVEFVASDFELDGKPVSREPERPQEKITYKLGALDNIVGIIGVDEAMSAASVEGNNDDIAICGIFTMATDFLSKGSGAKRSRPYQKFLLYDGEYTLQCRLFPRDGFSLIDSVPLNTPVCVFGNTAVERGRTGEIGMTVRSIAACKPEGLKAVPAHAVPRSYKTVKPSDYEEYVQASLFSDDVLPPSLHGSFVAFDFETTGLSIFYDKPTEIGAVKIVDGVITETFSTLIDPQRPIPDDVSEKTGITDAMVKGKPLFEDVLPDFYKFSQGCALIGHNIAFDFPFLVKYGNRFGYPFGDRRTFDTLGMAPMVFPGIELLTLNHVLEQLGLVNDNAHRALSDATATAKAFIAMQKKLYTGK